MVRRDFHLPNVNTAGEFVGIIFDGNLQSLSAAFGYEDAQSRALSVHSAGILEALRHVYTVPALVNSAVSEVGPALRAGLFPTDTDRKLDFQGDRIREGVAFQSGRRPRRQFPTRFPSPPISRPRLIVT